MDEDAAYRIDRPVLVSDSHEEQADVPDENLRGDAVPCLSPFMPCQPNEIQSHNSPIRSLPEDRTDGAVDSIESIITPHRTASLERPLAIEKNYSVSRNDSDHSLITLEDGSKTFGKLNSTKGAQVGYNTKSADAKSRFGEITDEKKANEAVPDTRSFRLNTSTLTNRFSRLAPCNIKKSACQNRECTPLFMHTGGPEYEKSGYSTNNDMGQTTPLSKDTSDIETFRMETAISPLLSSYGNMVRNDEMPNSRLCDIRESRLTSGLAKFHKPSSASVNSAPVDPVARSSKHPINHKPYEGYSAPLHRHIAQSPRSAPKLFQVTDRVNAFRQARGKAAPCVKRPRLDSSSGRSSPS
ncbi:hypothetical protein K450DRAFT_226836 [Umbelopsis ramanniana AG]|uniref:Uncharacterized protein n=1 Tax=Umbelopsis ramanniana AG TaxID=1314678 RepID=A0AAD5EF82_UMBRA|nr:uncharacterized protein K450DRAFT_226836 [Umbelopsis ramanniana AG]KAI8582771.1 hypothetical protein K450DRAFT_226836 [Umbelopsis ramanniana AG]